MREPISLDQAEYKSALAASLFETILGKTCVECLETLPNHISLACDPNQEIHQALIVELRMEGTK